MINNRSFKAISAVLLIITVFAFVEIYAHCQIPCGIYSDEMRFKIIEEDGKHQLLAKQLKNGPLPKFKDYKKQLEKYKGWHIVYSDQCPWVSRFINELDKKTTAKLKLKLTELKIPKQAQDAPSIYSVFNLIHDGKVLADHYVSNTRFKNILKKEA